MGYELEALVAKESLLRKHQSAFSKAYVAPFAPGFALIPVTDAFKEEVNRQAPERSKPELHGFASLSPAVAAWAERISLDGAVAYIEADYFGDRGSEVAIVWQDGMIAAGPLSSGDAISHALRMLGMEWSPWWDTWWDEYATVGLGQHRRTDAWVSRAR